MTRVTSWRLWAAVRREPLLPVLAILLLALAGAYPEFATVANLRNIAMQASPLVIAAVGMTFVIMTGGIDLSVGSMLFLAAAIETTRAVVGLPTAVVFAVVCAAGVGMGLLNGAAVAFTQVPALVVTLAAMQVFRGAGGHVTGQQNIDLPANLRGIGTATLLGVPAPVLLAAAVALTGGVVFRRTTFGRYVQAVGSSPGAALDAGLPVRGVLVGVYALAGLLAAFASLTQTARLGAVQPSIGQGYELTVITAVVLGGTALFGGRGSIGGTVLGALVLTTVQTGLVFSGASPYVFDIVRGGVLLAAVLAAGARWRTVAHALRLTGRGRPSSA
ncbi:ABC transporter permease [Dactylosporangium sp. AC04546]|uniref:ABC transporter permease n=1 Tax=Dactylosporangium sp. AC04546 TaxID=2862460 RepID=UPI001EDF2536|nr:ABC transporter permease [Dactylosporangium sp. AC04546]WVK79021.1 ABC transporter permease [Dactylosporangium sp. AC04546]